MPTLPSEYVRLFDTPDRLPMLELEFAERSHTGRVRPENQDRLGRAIPRSAAHARTHGYLFVLADGVGGQQRGELAAQMVVDSMTAEFFDAAAGEAHASTLHKLIERANTGVYQAASRQFRGMASTVVACALRFDRATIAHVGDSRCYYVHRGTAVALTRDHTLAAEQSRLGVLSQQEAARSAAQHILSRAVGADLFIRPEIDEQQLTAGDALMLCSDGFYRSVSEREIAACLKKANLEEAAEELVGIANARDGSDNISVQLIRIRQVERTGMYRGRPYTIR